MHDVNTYTLTISIHALHEESDRAAIGVPPPFDISIHALHEESDGTTPRPAVYWT